MEYVEKHVTTAYGSERIDWQSAIRVGLTLHANPYSSVETLYTYIFPWRFLRPTFGEHGES